MLTQDLSKGWHPLWRPIAGKIHLGQSPRVFRDEFFEGLRDLGIDFVFPYQDRINVYIPIIGMFMLKFVIF